MSDETDNLNRDVQQTKEHAASSFGQLKDDAVRVAQSAADTAKAHVDNVKDQVRTKLSDGTDAVRDAAYRARARGNDLLGQVQDKIEENPLQAVAIAAGVGVVLGILLRR